MKNYRFWLVGFLIWAISACSSSKEVHTVLPVNDPIEALGKEIEMILTDSVLSQSRTGLKIVSLESGETLYSRNENQLFHPASNMKLLSTAVALKRLGPSFQFKTTVYADSGAVADSSVNGNVYLHGSGDPDLLSNDLRKMVQQLKNQGIRRIQGNLICDDSYLDELYWGSGWMWDDASAWYWAPIYALNVDDNCVTVTVKPGKKVGDDLVVQIDPPTNYMKIINNGKTVAADDSVQLDAYRTQREWKHPENTITVEGGRTVNARPRNHVIDVLDATLYAGTIFSELLNEAGIGFDGKIQRGLVPQNAEMLTQHLSPPLTETIINTNKISDNLSAELLLKVTGAEMRGKPGTAGKGISEIKKLLHTAGVDSTTYRLADGSGVSRYNVITPFLLTQLLKYMHEDFGVQAEFKASLPIAGVDGSLSSRMKGTAAENNLRAKTGSLSGVSSLAGYTTTAEGELLAFSMIMEHFVVRTSKVRAIQDRIGDAMSRFRRKRVTSTASSQ